MLLGRIARAGAPVVPECQGEGGGPSGQPVGGVGEGLLMKTPSMDHHVARGGKTCLKAWEFSKQETGEKNKFGVSMEVLNRQGKCGMRIWDPGRAGMMGWETSHHWSP